MFRKNAHIKVPRNVSSSKGVGVFYWMKEVFLQSLRQSTAVWPRGTAVGGGEQERKRKGVQDSEVGEDLRK